MTISINIKSKLDHFNMDINWKSSARRIGILGASGAGKSMLLKYIAGIHTPDQGRIEIEDRCLFGEGINVPPQKRNVAYMFQNYALFPNMTVEDNIKIIAKGSKEEKQAKVEFLLRKFHIEDIRQKKPGELSGGQQQRVALARIMAYEPKVILLDEPFSALDESLKENLQIELMEMIADFDGTVIMVSHSRDEIYSFSEELIVISEGESVCIGDTKSIFFRPPNIEAAKMVGFNNIIEAKVLGDELIIPSLNMNIPLKLLSEDRGDNWKVDQINYVCLRDEDIKMVNSETAGAEPIARVIVDRIVSRYGQNKVYFHEIHNEDKRFSMIIKEGQLGDGIDGLSEVDITLDLKKIVLI